jgi:signal transduction histidine kinase
MPDLSAAGMTRSERILTERLEILYRNTTAILANLATSCIVAWMVSDSFPHRALALWLGSVAIVCIARLWLQRRFWQAPAEQRCTHCAARRFAFGAVASGLLWGIACLGLPRFGDDMDYIVFAVTAAGMTAGAVSTISVYYPAFFGYTLVFAAPLTAVSLLNRNSDIAGAGAMMVLYYLAISVAAWRANRFVVTTAELRVDNQILKASLDTARGERDAARTDKWSTLAQLSHELRTPLNAILGFSEAMAGEIFGCLGHRRYKEYAEHIQTSGGDLLNLAEELLLLSQGEAGTLVLKEAPVDVSKMVRDLIDLKAAIAGQAGLALHAFISPHLPMLNADASKLRQMLLNLIDNAIKFTPAGGSIDITATERNSGVVLIVGDTGIGMSKEQIDVALQPFGRAANSLTNNTAGAGLGLPICRRLAELHGATLAVQSVVGGGSTFTLCFPAARTIAGANAAAA